MKIYEILAKVQKSLKAPKSQYNSFGKYSYRSCEDILEAAKPLCCDNGLVLCISDEVVDIGGRIYVKSTASVHDANGDSVSACGYAREPESKKGMDDSQITGAASSYARKYALNGLFCIDDTKDADATNTHESDKKLAEALKEKASAAGIAEPAKVFKCCDCGKAFTGFTDANGVQKSAEEQYNISISYNTDKKARCGACMKKAGTDKRKAG